MNCVRKLSLKRLIWGAFFFNIPMTNQWKRFLMVFKEIKRIKTFLKNEKKRPPPLAGWMVGWLAQHLGSLLKSLISIRSHDSGMPAEESSSSGCPRVWPTGPGQKPNQPASQLEEADSSPGIPEQWFLIEINDFDKESRCWASQPTSQPASQPEDGGRFRILLILVISLNTLIQGAFFF